ncbi:MAG: ABC transporter ATP-binding protein [Patescibacteria group bacterium]|nr:MAG: ABC transporter ATP-binding protein [Patescibacteria group bacterium]
MISLKNLSVSVGEKKILKNINFNFEKNKVYALMGPNGSGKSTLASIIVGHPSYTVEEGKIFFENDDITELDVDERAKKGIFLSFQQPLSLSGVTVFQLLRLALSGKKDPLKVKEEIDFYAKKLKIKKELIERSLNDGASGGEKKKLEVLQAALLEPKFLILDEVDTGVDVDALKTIALFLDEFKKDKTVLIITHYYRILKYLQPDYVMVMIDGEIKKVGDKTLAEKIEKEGYEVIS